MNFWQRQASGIRCQLRSRLLSVPKQGFARNTTPPVLVLDNINIVAQGGLGLLYALQHSEPRVAVMKVSIGSPSCVRMG